MLAFFGRWFKVYKDEIGMFAGALVLLFLVRGADMILNNYAETAFLKRYGVEYLPVMYMVNSLSIFFIMGFITGMLTRMPGTRLLTYLMVFCGVSVTGVRLVIPVGWDLVYPILFVLKSLYEALMGLLFWNMANDLFNTRQSKRLFPLLSAGGVCGDILAGFGTPVLARLIMIDNLLFVYLGLTMAGAVVVRTMSLRYPTLLIAEGSGKKKRRKRSSLLGEISKTIPLMKKSFLVKVLIFMTLFPNIIIPIMNYQFNFVANEMFATEGGLVTFLGYFRGSMNVVSLLILLFVGRIYGRWGLPVALMFHPANYLFVFIGFLMRFDIFAAMYARLSTNIIRTTLNKPATDILMGLIPVSQRAVLRPFLRGTIVRIALLIGSGSILATEHLFHPRYLSLVAIPCIAAWLGSIITLKRRYSDILLDLISRDQIDVKSMEDRDLGQLFRDNRTRERLAAEFEAAEESNAVWYAKLLQSTGAPDLDRIILRSLQNREPSIQIELIGMLSKASAAEAARELARLFDSPDAAVSIAALREAGRIDPSAAARIDFERFLSGHGGEAAGYAAAALYQRDPARFEEQIGKWLASSDPETLRAGVLAAGRAGSRQLAGRLIGLLEDDRTVGFRAEVIESLRQAGRLEDSAALIPFLSHEEEAVREAALRAVAVSDDAVLAKVIDLLADNSRRIRRMAREKIESAPHHNTDMLIEGLNSPRRQVREQIYEILDSLNIRDLDAFRFVQGRARQAYRYLAAAEGLRRFEDCKARNLIIDHFTQKRETAVENALRVLAAQDETEQITLILRGIFSADIARRANAIEALEDRLDKRLSRMLVPLLELSDPASALAAAHNQLGVAPAEEDDGRFLNRLLLDEDWIVVLLTLAMVRQLERCAADPQTLCSLLDSSSPSIRRQAAAAVDPGAAAQKEFSMENETTLSDKIILLRGIEIFEGLAVGELAAVASVTEEIDSPAGEIVIREGEPGETLYLIIKGEVSVIKGLGSDNEIELDRIRAGDYFGEMALFEDIERTASIKTISDSRLLVLHKLEFKQIVREYPQIALEICKVLSLRIRRLHQKIKEKKG
ncbi:MAG: Npt1/Npt2 family nucleotide transporter [Desulfobacterales bacterium]|jgi:HEAT repeat protein